MLQKNKYLEKEKGKANLENMKNMKYQMENAKVNGQGERIYK